jgi:hypothetical protein
MAKERIIIRGIDRTDDYRVVCEKCKRDFGGTVAAREGHAIRYVLCPSCEFSSFENQMRAIKARLASE